MKNKNFWYLVLSTFILGYLIVGFVRWEFDWVKHLADTSGSNRLWFVLAIVGKLILDFGLWRFIKSNPRNEEDQKSYIYGEEDYKYDKDGNPKS